MLNIIIQIILSLFLISIMAFIGYSIYNTEYIDNISIINTNKKKTLVYDGILNYSDDSNVIVETYDKAMYGYRDINASINQNGGIEYSYNFWLYFNPNTSTGFLANNNFGGTLTISPELSALDSTSTFTSDYKYIILFYKGEAPAPIIMNSHNYECEQSIIIANQDTRILIKNPLVKIRNDCKEIIIELNNINFPETYNYHKEAFPGNCASADDYSSRNKNKFGIKDIDISKYKEKFNMVTIVIQEQPKKEDIINSARTNCRIYFNGVLINDTLTSNENNIDAITDTIADFSSSAIKSNLSKLRIFPTDIYKTSPTVENVIMDDLITKKPSLQMSDLSYYNYALLQSEITRLYKNGFNQYPAIVVKKMENLKYTKGTYSAVLDNSTKAVGKDK